MAEFAIFEVCRATGAELCQSGQASAFPNVSTDTRNIKTGDLFIALAGENFDGHNFIEVAISNGAAGVVISRDVANIPASVTVFKVKDCLRALQDLAKFHRLRFAIPVVAITGSNGKTTTKDMVAAILSYRFQVLKTEANFNNEIGLPLTLLQLNSSHQAAVVEMGMRGLGQIRELAKIALPTIAVITNVGQTHMELLGSIENIAAAKAELLEVIPSNGLVVLNADNAYVHSMAKKVQGQRIFYGVELGDIQATAIKNEENGMSFTCVTAAESYPMHLPAVGRHNVYNALAGICVGKYLGLAWEEINQGLQTFNTGGMRLQIEKIGQYTIINDAYNASPASMNAAIDTLVEIAPARKVAVLGDMLELGHVAEEAHCQVGQKLATHNIDVVITVGALARHIADTAKALGVSRAISCESHEKAQTELQRVLKPGDTILIKGSRGMKMEKIIGVLH